MDIATILGLVGGMAVVIFGAMQGGSIGGLIDIGSVFITIFGSYFCMFTNYPLRYCLGVFKVMGLTFKVPDFGEKSLVQKLVSFAERARREGLLALEDELEDLVDGTDAEVIKSILENELGQMESRHATWIGFLNGWATLGPGFGMLGTVIGLIGMLTNLEDKSSLGPNMAVALVTTLYGSLLANWLLIPMAGKLSYINDSEVRSKEMIIEGVLSIQAGDNPRILAMKLLTYLDVKDRKAIEGDALKD